MFCDRCGNGSQFRPVDGMSYKLGGDLNSDRVGSVSGADDGCPKNGVSLLLRAVHV